MYNHILTQNVDILHTPDQESEIIATQSVNEAHDMLTLESYLTAKTVRSTEKQGVPAGIVLELGQSDSMADMHDKANTRQTALKRAVNSYRKMPKALFKALKIIR